MTSSYGNIFPVTGFCVGNLPLTGEFPAQSLWRVSLMFSLICTWIKGWLNNREAGDLRRHRADYDVTVMMTNKCRILRIHWWISFNFFLILPHGTQWIIFLNTLKPRQNGRQFPDDISIFLNENVSISIKMSLKFLPYGPINNIQPLVQIMTWRRTGDKPLSEPMLTRFTGAYMRH